MLSRRLLPVPALLLGLLLAPVARAQFFVDDPLNETIYTFSSTGVAQGTASTTYVSHGIAYAGTTVYADANSGSRSNYTYDYTYTDGTGLSTSSLYHTFTAVNQAPTSVAAAGSDVYIGTSTGTAGTVSLFTPAGLSGTFAVTGSVVGLAAANDLFVATGNNAILEYSLTGAAVNTSFLTGLSGPLSVAASATDLYVANGSSVTDYSLNANGTLAATNSSFITGLTVSGTPAIAVSGSYLLVTNGNDVAEYTTGGVLINSDVAAASAVDGIAAGTLTAIPEPSTYAAVLGAAALAGALVWNRRRTAA